MMPAREEHGFTLVELLVAMGLSLIVIGSVVAILTVFLNDSRYNQLRDQAQNDSRSMVDRLSRDLRSAASPTAGSSGLLENAGSYDLVFQTVSPSTVYTGNPSNQYRVRYCLDGSLTMWRQTQTWTSVSAPSVPDTSNCPSTSNQWAQKSGGSPCCIELTDVTNEIGGDTTRPLFTYGPTGWSSIAQIQEVQVNVLTDLNPGHLPGPSPQLTSGIFLRNANAPPVSNFTVSQTATGSSTRDVVLNGSGSTDPNGQTLSYQWYNGGSCTAPTSPFSPGNTQVYDAGNFSTGANQTFLLVVTDTAGLTNCSSQTVAIS
jgi:type II secretory pathway pseudopilin PulG